MKIALYHPWIYLKGGIEREILELVRRSRHDWVIFTNHYESANTFEGYKNLQVVELDRVAIDRDMGTVLKAAVKLLRQKLPLGGFDALVVKCDGLGNLITFRNRKLPTICLCSTPLRPVYDEVYALAARGHRGMLGRLLFSLFQTSFRAIDGAAWKNYQAVIAVSHEVKRRITTNGLFPDCDRLKVHHPGIDPSDAPVQVSYEPFLLVAGRIMWTKNIELAIEAFQRAQMPAPWRLVITGFVDKKSSIYLQCLKEQSGASRVEFVVSPTDQVFNDLLERASAVLFPPLNEDWGIVPLEAMLRSKAIMANARGGPAESVVHGKTGWLLAPDPEQWAAVMKTFPEQPEMLESMGREARRHVDRYDWNHFVCGVDDAVDQQSGTPVHHSPSSTEAKLS